MQLAVCVLAVEGFKSFINSYFITFRNNAIDQAMKIDRKVSMSIGFIHLSRIVPC